MWMAGLGSPWLLSNRRAYRDVELDARIVSTTFSGHLLAEDVHDFYFRSGACGTLTDGGFAFIEFQVVPYSPVVNVLELRVDICSGALIK